MSVENSHFHCHTNAVVDTQGCSLCLHPLAVDVSLDGILREVELYVAVLLAYHIHMALQDNRLPVLHAGCRRLADNDVARLVSPGVETKLLSEVEQEVNHLLFLLRRTRYLVHLCKALEYTLGLQ